MHAAVTGMGCLCAAGLNVAQCVDSIFSDSRNPALPVRFQSTHPQGYPVYELPQEAVAWHGAEELLLTSRLGLLAAREALEHAGWDLDALRKLRVGVCLGTTVGSAMNNERFYSEFRQGHDPDMNAITRFLRSNPAEAVARELRLNGPVQTVVNACSSGADAIGIGAGWVETGLCDVVIAGGADELCRVTYNGFISLMIHDTEPCRPFDATRKGLNLGEGAGVLVLESEYVRSSRKARARARVLAYGCSCDAHHLTAPHPQGDGLKRALKQVLENIPAQDVAFVNAHGTGTKDNDRVESLVLSEALPDIPFCSTKGHTGHTLGAAGGLEAVFTIACLQQGRIPASMGCTEPDPELPAAPVLRETEVSGSVALSQSLAFGGCNAVLALGLSS